MGLEGGLLHLAVFFVCRKMFAREISAHYPQNFYIVGKALVGWGVRK